MSGLQGLRGWKVWTFLGLSMVLVITVFMFQVGTVLPGAPDVCEEPCEDEAVITETDLPRDSTSVPALEPFAAPVDPATAPDGSSTEPAEAQVTEPSVATIETPSPVDVSLSTPVETEVSADAPPAGQVEAVAPEPPAVPVDADVSAGGSPTETIRMQEAQQPSTAVKPPTPVESPASSAIEIQLSTEMLLGEPGEESAVARLEADLEVAKREKAEAQAAAAGRLVPVKVVPGEPFRPAAQSPRTSEPRLLPLRLIVPAPRGSVPVARGAMDYRVPLVVKQEVPDRIQGGAYIPSHETYVILRPGHWELKGSDEGLAATEPEAGAVEATGDMIKPELERRGWLQRLFRRKSRRADGGS